MKKLVFAK